LKNKLTWHKVLNIDELPEGRVKSVSAANKSFAVTHFDGKYSALDNRCPHQGGPLGEGNIENGWLRCPWHGYDFHPCTGRPPEGFDDAVEEFPCEVKDDGIYIGLKETVAQEKTTSDVMVETMINWGVTHVFGMVGHSNLGLADAFRKQVEDGKLNYIGIRHEGAASFAASAYAKLTGKPAACFSIAGPGATNLLTGLCDAKVDRAPVLTLTGQVDTQVLGPGAFQEVDLSSAFEAVAEWKQTVLPSSKHAELMTIALKNAILKRDVSHLIFPNEVQQIPVKEETASSPEGRLTTQNISPPEEEIDKAIEQLSSAKRPVIVVGHGARFNMEKITALSEKLDVPVITTFKGKGLIPDNHPLACGVLGRSGTPIASWFMNESDLLLVFGASFSNHTGIAPYIPTIQVDFDPMALGKFHAVTVPVWGEIGITVDILLQKMKKQRRDYNIKSEIAEKWNLWRAEKQSREGDDSGKGINSASVFAAMNKHVPDNAVITVDVGNNAYSFGRYFECKKQSVLMSGYLGSIGFGYPAAIGAWAAAPERPIVAVTGDGGFAQSLAEVTTAVKYGMNIKHILLNNNELGKISKEQRADELNVWETDLRNPDFSKYAELCGATGIRITEKDKLNSAMKKLFEVDGPAMIEIMSDPLLT
jgi:thiamine pyrophosphate-dependent acetolactate synthase large subunit-like protein/nitrite reductase/ring-hydroxylating ferredoxin subunit